MDGILFDRIWRKLGLDYEIQQIDGSIEENESWGKETIFSLAPYHLGLVDYFFQAELTPAGKNLICSKNKSDVILRQILKFQIPSPMREKACEKSYCLKPFLEILRLIRSMGFVTFDELQLFGALLTDYRDFDKTLNAIKKYRKNKPGNIGVKRTQSSNMRDYADACFRYLRITGLVNVSHVGKSLSIVPERIAEVDYILKNIKREPVHVDDKNKYEAYLGDASLPRLLTDDRTMLEQKIQDEFPDATIDASASLDELKDMLADMLDERKQSTITEQVAEIKDYRQYDDIQQTYEQIVKSEVYDAPLMLEWNTWRAMTMLDGGDIKANLNFDDYGKPLSTAAGNMSDIICDYGDFMVCVEVTMSSGQKQYEMEGEPVTRHLGKLKKASNKPCYCLFVAPTINDACVTHFYTLHHLNLANYGGKSTIVPLPIEVFRKMVDDSYKANYTPNPTHVRQFFETSNEYAQTCQSDVEWYEKMKDKALHWLE